MAYASTDELLDRDGELAELLGLIAEVDAGSGRAAVIEGAPGIGKSSVLAAALGGLPPLNMWVRTAPRDAERFCWRIEVMPRLAQLAGLEIGTGVHLNVLAPEDAAERLRSAG